MTDPSPLRTPEGPQRPMSRMPLVATARDRVEPPGAELARVILMAAAFTATWTAVAVRGIKPTDLLVAGAVVLVVPMLLTVRGLPPWWVLGPAAGICGVALLQQLLPTSSTYLAARITLDAIGNPVPAPATGALGVVVRWLFALVALSAAARGAYGARPDRLEGFAWAWVVGAGVSAAVALSDAIGLTEVSVLLNGPLLLNGRQLGLTTQPNHLGVASAMAVPVALVLARRRPTAGGAVTAVLVAGVLLSGSRGAQGATALVLLACALASPAIRRRIGTCLYLGAIGLWVLGVLQVTGRLAVGHLLRFDSDVATVAGDGVRVRLLAQGWADVREDPVLGVGLRVLLEAHNGYLQLLAAGGVLLLLLILTMWGGALAHGLRVAREGRPLAWACCASLVMWMLMASVENQLTDRYLYLPVAILAAYSRREAP